MRLWSIHPMYLDPQGLVALWREGLLAKKVLEGKTKGYKHHPQLVRFKETRDPVASINLYLFGVLEESRKRGYSFSEQKIEGYELNIKMPVTQGQLAHELEHLRKKLGHRNPSLIQKLPSGENIQSHPIFTIVRGGVHPWERLIDSKDIKK